MVASPAVSVRAHRQQRTRDKKPDKAAGIVARDEHVPFPIQIRIYPGGEFTYGMGERLANIARPGENTVSSLL